MRDRRGSINSSFTSASGGLSGIEEAGNSSLTSASGGLSGIEEAGK